MAKKDREFDAVNEELSAQSEQTPEAPAPTLDQVSAALEIIRLQAKNNEGILDRFAAIAESNNRVQREQLKQTKRRSNDASPKISVYNFRGEKDYPMPELKCEIVAPFHQKNGMHGFDREEVELLNLLELGVYPIELNDDSVKVVHVAGRRNSITQEIEEMGLYGPKDADTHQYTALFTSTNKQQFPGLKVILRAMLGEKADHVMTMKQERKQTELYTAALKKGQDFPPDSPVFEPRHTADYHGPLAVSVGE